MARPDIVPWSQYRAVLVKRKARFALLTKQTDKTDRPGILSSLK